MFARLGKFLARAFGKVLYWIGWGVAILLIAQAIILAVTSGNVLLPMLLGGVGVIVWLVVIGFKYITRIDFESIGRRVAFWYTAALLAVLCLVAFYFYFSHLTSGDGGAVPVMGLFMGRHSGLHVDLASLEPGGVSVHARLAGSTTTIAGQCKRLMPREMS